MTMKLAGSLKDVPGVREVDTSVEPELDLRSTGNERAHHVGVPLAAGVRNKPCGGVDHLVRLGQRPKGSCSSFIAPGRPVEGSPTFD